MQIRAARLDDAGAACRVLRRSIVELCVLDHGNDPAILERWLASKTPQNVAAWIGDRLGHVFVAEEVETILGVGAVTTAVEIQLNYVSPDARFRGVSHALIERLEHAARQDGNAQCSLTSTQTAHRFYLARGYIDAGTLPGTFGTAASFAMIKPLGAKASG